MKARFLTITAILFLVFSVSSYATDRNARFIDSIGAFGMSYKDGQMTGYQIWGETALGRTSRDWALIVGGGIGSESPDKGNDSDFWDGLGGMKYYFSDFTSLALVGSYMAYDSDAHLKISAASLIGKHRFIEAAEGVSPFFTASATYRSRDYGNDNENEDEIVGTVGLGCEFMMNQDLSIVFEASYIHGESLDSGGAEIQDGVMGAIYVTGYWD